MSVYALESNDSTLVEYGVELNLIEHWSHFLSNPSLAYLTEFQSQLDEILADIPFKSVEPQIFAVLNNLHADETLIRPNARHNYWLCEGLFELLRFKTQSARILKRILIILQINLKHSLNSFHLEEKIVNKCTRSLENAALEEHEALQLLSILTKMLFSQVRPPKQQLQLQRALVDFFIALQNLSPTSSIPLNLPRVIASWTVNPYFTDGLTKIVIDSLTCISNSFSLRSHASNVANKISHTIIEVLWDTNFSENILKLVRTTSETLAENPSAGAHHLLLGFLYSLFELSWEIKSERYTEFVFRVMSVIFEILPQNQRSFEMNLHYQSQNLRVQLHSALIQLTELLCQLMSCEDLSMAYRPALFEATSKMTSKFPLAITETWFNHVRQAKFPECLALMPIAEQFSLSNHDKKPLERLHSRIIVDQSPNCWKSRLEYYELLKYRVISSDPVDLFELKCLFLGLLNLRSWQKLPISNMCVEVLNERQGAENFAKLLHDSSGTSEAAKLCTSLEIVLKSHSKSQDLSLGINKSRVRLVVDELMYMKQFATVAFITDQTTEGFPKKWFSQCLRWAFSLEFNFEDRTACLSIIKKFVISLGCQSLEFVDVTSVFGYLLLQLKTCHLAHIGIVSAIMKVLSGKMMNTEGAVLSLQILLRRTIKALHEAHYNGLEKDTFDRLLLISKNVLYWPTNEVERNLLVEVLLRAVKVADNERTERIALSILMKFRRKWPRSVDEAELLGLILHIFEFRSSKVIAIVFNEGIPHMAGPLKPIKSVASTERSRFAIASISKESNGKVYSQKIGTLLLGKVSKLLRCVYTSESLFALDVLGRVVRNGSVAVNECIPVTVALCFSRSFEVAKKARELMTEFFDCWPNECSLKFAQGIRLIKQPESASHLPFALLCEQFSQKMSVKSNTSLLLSLGNLFDPQDSDLKLLTFLERCLRTLSYRSSEVAKLEERIQYCATRFEVDDPRRKVCTKLTNWFVTRYNLNIEYRFS